jgi:hypothetical protein
MPGTPSQEGLSNANPIRALLKAGLAKSFSQARRMSMQMDGKEVEKRVAKAERDRQARKENDEHSRR